jgi:hypothetical protein
MKTANEVHIILGSDESVKVEYRKWIRENAPSINILYLTACTSFKGFECIHTVYIFYNNKISTDNTPEVI